MNIRYIKESAAKQSYSVYNHGHRPASYGVIVDGARRGALVGLAGSYRRGSYRLELDGRRVGDADTLKAAKHLIEWSLAHPEMLPPIRTDKAGA